MLHVKLNLFKNCDPHTRCPRSYSAILSISSFIFSMFCRLFSSHSYTNKQQQMAALEEKNIIRHFTNSSTLAQKP